MERTDAELVAALRAGDEDTFRELVHTWNGSMLRVAQIFVPPRAVQQHSLIDLAEVERVTDLLRRPALDVAQGDHGTLARRQRLDRPRDQLARLRREDALLRQLARRRRPAARMQRVVLGQEAIRVDRGLRHAARLVQRRERQRPALALRPCLRGVDEDAEHPRLQRGAALEAVEAPEHAEPGLLHYLLGNCARGDVHHRDPQHRRTVETNEVHERGFVAGAELLQQATFVRDGRDCARSDRTIPIRGSSRWGRETLRQEPFAKNVVVRNG